MADTIFVKGDIVVGVREKPSVFSYLGARPRIRMGERYEISDFKRENNLEFYRVGKDVNWYSSIYFALEQRTIPYTEWSELSAS